MERARTKAVRGLAYLGVYYDEPKFGSVQRLKVSDGNLIWGLSTTERDFLIKVVADQTHKLWAARNAAQWSCDIFHEVVHCARGEQFKDYDNLAELVATEGLAYMAEQLYTKKFCSKQVVPKLQDWDVDKIDPELREGFTVANANSVGLTRASLRWHERMSSSFAGNGALYGAQCVQQHLNAGHSIADMLYRPAEELLEG